MVKLRMPQRLWTALLAVAKRIGHVQAWVILTIFYFVVLAPAALLFQLTADPLHLRRRSGSVWERRPQIPDPRAWAKSQ